MTSTCVEWEYTSASGGASGIGFTFGLSKTCKTTVTTTTYKYYP